ncbi:IS481 family transposase [Candidatus Poriferisocius sp.]|uniref:IS481 family transposase n=1 Tax=Candidatus Poriferisocius sp. TaxID=3101276 RepID=UPI003B028AEA
MVAKQVGVSRGTVAKWYRCWCDEGSAGLYGRSSRLHSSPRRTSAGVGQRICGLRRSTERGPVYLAVRTGVPVSTVWRILCRNGLNRLGWLDRPTGQVIRRYEREASGELVHLDIKKVVRVPPGGGWRAHGRGSAKARRRKRKRVAYTYLHVAIHDYSRVVYVEAHDNETTDTVVGFWQRAQDWFWSNDMAVNEVLTDNGANFCSDAFAVLLAERAIAHRRTRPYRPQTNPKAGRFNRTLAEEFLYAHKFRSEADHRRRLTQWIHRYNCHRHHTAIGGPPATRAHNLTRTDN